MNFPAPKAQFPFSPRISFANMQRKRQTTKPTVFDPTHIKRTIYTRWENSTNSQLHDLLRGKITADVPLKHLVASLKLINVDHELDPSLPLGKHSLPVQFHILRFLRSICDRYRENRMNGITTARLYNTPSTEAISAILTKYFATYYSKEFYDEMPMKDWDHEHWYRMMKKSHSYFGVLRKKMEAYDEDNKIPVQPAPVLASPLELLCIAAGVELAALKREKPVRFYIDLNEESPEEEEVPKVQDMQPFVVIGPIKKNPKFRGNFAVNKATKN
jgi:hypothetical protein